MNGEGEIPPPSGGLSSIAAVLFYGFLVLLAWLLGVLWLDLDLLVWHDDFQTSLVLDAGLGVGLGIATVIATRILEVKARWARVLSEEFRKILGPVTVWQALVLALSSGIAEEVFFRGFLQQALTDLVFGGGTGAAIAGLVLSSLIFGLIHIGPDREKFLPWTIMALVMGFCFGGLYLYTGNLVAPVVAHFTINFFNLQLITNGGGEEG